MRFRYHLLKNEQVRKALLVKLIEKPIDAPQKIQLARKAKVSQWLLSACVELVGRGEPLTLKEIGTLDWETIARLLLVQQQRPEIWRKQLEIGGYRVYCRKGPDHYIDADCQLIPETSEIFDVEESVKEAFQSELLSIQAWEAEWEGR